MLPRIERVLHDWIGSGARGIGQNLIATSGEGFTLCPREDESTAELGCFHLHGDKG